MKASELRIGNLLQDRNGRLCKVEQVSKQLQECNIYAIKYSTTSLPFEPIHLTEEWLLKLGCKMYELFSSKYYLVTDGNITLVSNKNGIISMEIEGQLLPLKHTQYVHQLQNLYFTLTGEELTIS